MAKLSNKQFFKKFLNNINLIKNICCKLYFKAFDQMLHLIK